MSLPPGDGRFELLRALGAVTRLRGDDRRRVEDALGIEPLCAALHTEVFVLEAPPYSSVHLGPEGMLGGEAADRVAGFARALHVAPLSEPDHLASLLDLYAALGDAACGEGHGHGDRWGAGDDERDGPRRSALGRAREALLFEHLWSWLPGYLVAVAELGCAPATAWARLLLAAVAREVAQANPPDRLPLALRDAPGPVTGAGGRSELLAAATAPVRSGIVLTRSRLRSAAAQIGAGLRVGERRFALGALLDQDPEPAAAWLAAEAARWVEIHERTVLLPAAVDPARWWSKRAAATAAAIAR